MREYRLVNGDITNADTDFIAHQVNCKGAMGSGVAKAIKTKWPMVYNSYMKTYNMYKENTSNNTSGLLGTVQFVPIYLDEEPKKPYYCANMFTQDSFGFIPGKQHTSVEAFKEALIHINVICQGHSIAFPWLIGCVRGGADWNVILPLILETLTDVKEIVFYKF